VGLIIDTRTIIKYTLEALRDINGFNVLYEIEEDEKLYEELLDELCENVISKQFILEPIPDQPGDYYVKGTRYDS